MMYLGDGVQNFNSINNNNNNNYQNKIYKNENVKYKTTVHYTFFLIFDLAKIGT